MKKIVLILSLFMLSMQVVRAQDDATNEKLRDKMREYIQLRLKLNKDEAEKFTPVFIRYFREWRGTLRERDPLLLQQKIVELRIRYRPEFQEIIGERRSNEVFKRQDEFIRELKEIRQERLRERQNPGPRRTQRMI